MKTSIAVPTIAALAGGLLLSASAQAVTLAPTPETIGYYTTLSNITGFPSGDYAKVLISNVNPTTQTIDGNIYFDVSPTSFFNTAPLSEGPNFGLQGFSFNYSPASLNLSASDITLISPSSGWSVSLNKNAGGGFGTFDVSYSGTGGSRTTDLQFSIGNVSGDSPSSYAVPNSNGYYFSTDIAGFVWTDSTVSSGKFVSDGTAPVPLPGAVWLFASGLLGLAGVARRRA